MTAEDGPSASVIVPLRNARGYVRDQLDALASQLADRDIECIVIDDASTDGTADTIRAWIDLTDNADQFRLIERAVRGGPNASRNDGLRHARAQFMMFTDGDDVVAPGWIDAFASASGTDGLLCGRNAALADRHARGESHAGVEGWAPPRFGGWRFAFGNCMAGPRRIFEEPRGFDENIMIGGSETEFAIRAQRQLGIDVVGVPEALVWHRLPTTIGGWFKKHFVHERGYAYIRRRHRGAVRHPSVRIGVFQVARGLAGFVPRRGRTPEQSAAASGLLGRGTGGILGYLCWTTVLGLRLPPPKLLGPTK